MILVTEPLRNQLISLIDHFKKSSVTLGKYLSS